MGDTRLPERKPDRIKRDKQQRSYRRDQSFHSAGSVVPVCEWDIQDHQDPELVFDQCVSYFSDGIDRRYCQYDRRPNRMAWLHRDVPLNKAGAALGQLAITGVIHNLAYFRVAVAVGK